MKLMVLLQKRGPRTRSKDCPSVRIHEYLESTKGDHSTTVRSGWYNVYHHPLTRKRFERYLTERRRRQGCGLSLYTEQIGTKPAVQFIFKSNDASANTKNDNEYTGGGATVWIEMQRDSLQPGTV